MTADEVLNEVRGLIVKEMLDGDDAGLEPSTQLLELGVINSMSINVLISFVEERFSVAIPREEVTPDNLQTLNSITDLVMRLSG